ncbi:MULTISPECIES: hypothetical protein [Kamptonema]|uniref:hypothetical protein n=1 Tax=Kamptonema TaxID=1501433 RepID=UPI0001DAC827|nr:MULTISPECIES: hypothetical protein [Kamptonema]CBN56182.1 exported hypothetical protein [Kamptonema sp. PCC 6506]
MILNSLIPLILFLIAAAIALGTDKKTLDGIPGPLAAIASLVCLIWFVALSPWPIKVSLAIAVLALGKLFL